MKLTNLINFVDVISSDVDKFVSQTDILYIEYIDRTDKLISDFNKHTITNYVRCVVRIALKFSELFFIQNKNWEYSGFEKTVILNGLNGVNGADLLEELVYENFDNAEKLNENLVDTNNAEKDLSDWMSTDSTILDKMWLINDEYEIERDIHEIDDFTIGIVQYKHENENLFELSYHYTNEIAVIGYVYVSDVDRIYHFDINPEFTELSNIGNQELIDFIDDNFDILNLTDWMTTDSTILDKMWLTNDEYENYRDKDEINDFQIGFIQYKHENENLFELTYNYTNEIAVIGFVYVSDVDRIYHFDINPEFTELSNIGNQELIDFIDDNFEITAENINYYSITRQLFNERDLFGLGKNLSNDKLQYNFEHGNLEYSLLINKNVESVELTDKIDNTTILANTTYPENFKNIFDRLIDYIDYCRTNPDLEDDVDVDEDIDFFQLSKIVILGNPEIFIINTEFKSSDVNEYIVYNENNRIKYSIRINEIDESIEVFDNKSDMAIVKGGIFDTTEGSENWKLNQKDLDQVYEVILDILTESEEEKKKIISMEAPTYNDCIELINKVLIQPAVVDTLSSKNDKYYIRHSFIFPSEHEKFPLKCEIVIFKNPETQQETEHIKLYIYDDLDMDLVDEDVYPGNGNFNSIYKELKHINDLADGLTEFYIDYDSFFIARNQEDVNKYLEKLKLTKEEAENMAFVIPKIEEILKQYYSPDTIVNVSEEGLIGLYNNWFNSIRDFYMDMYRKSLGNNPIDFPDYD